MEKNNLTSLNKRSVLMHSHMDTVYFENTDFIPKIIDNKVFGLGSADDKASLEAMINLIIEISKNRNDINPTVFL